LLLLAACGLNGTDADEGEAANGQQTAAASTQDPALAKLEEENIPDPVQRPEMQLQVVLDQLGFGPGIIDGKMGLSTVNALKGFQEANNLQVTGEYDQATKAALARHSQVPATKVVRIPENWAQVRYQPLPDEPEDQAKLEHLSYQSIDEQLAERFHTTSEVLQALNPGGRPAGDDSPSQGAASANAVTAGTTAIPPRTRVTPTPTRTPGASPTVQPALFRPGQLIRVPNVGALRTNRSGCVPWPRSASPRSNRRWREWWSTSRTAG
jgi:peptidoglycan hydrolase-like protein with peptidoglycan-binding domain